MIGNEFYLSWEPLLMEWIQSHMGTVTTALASFCTNFGESLFLILILGYIYWCYDKEFGKYVGTNLLVGLLWNPMIKNVFNRRRPYFVHSNIKCLRAVEPEADIYDIATQGFSFPSGHSTCAVTVYCSLGAYKKNKFLITIAIILPILVGLSRVMLGVHYPTDVLTGWLLGGVTICIVSFLQKKIQNKKILYLLFTLSGIPGLFYCTSEDYFTSYGLMVGIFAAILFEEKYVNFQATKNTINCILRIVCGLLVFVIVNGGLKLLIPSSLAEAGDFTAHMLRLVRYGITGFIDMGVYPLFFAALDKKFVDKK